MLASGLSNLEVKILHNIELFQNSNIYTVYAFKSQKERDYVSTYNNTFILELYIIKLLIQSLPSNNSTITKILQTNLFQDVAEGIKQIGHVTHRMPIAWRSCVTAIARNGTMINSNSDNRRPGGIAGF